MERYKFESGTLEVIERADRYVDRTIELFNLYKTGSKEEFVDSKVSRDIDIMFFGEIYGNIITIKNYLGQFAAAGRDASDKEWYDTSNKINKKMTPLSKQALKLIISSKKDYKGEIKGANTVEMVLHKYHTKNIECLMLHNGEVPAMMFIYNDESETKIIKVPAETYGAEAFYMDVLKTDKIQILGRLDDELLVDFFGKDTEKLTTTRSISTYKIEGLSISENIINSYIALLNLAELLNADINFKDQKGLVDPESFFASNELLNILSEIEQLLDSTSKNGVSPLLLKTLAYLEDLTISYYNGEIQTEDYCKSIEGLSIR